MTKPTSTGDFDFGQKSAELEDVLRHIQNPETPVDQILELYERGAKLSHDLEKYLKNAENRLQKIKLADPSQNITAE